MSTYAIIIDVDGPPARVAYEGFSGLKKSLGMWVAEVASRPTIADFTTILLVDEEGRLKDSPQQNALASAVHRRFSYGGDNLVGPAAIVGDDGEDICGLTAEQAEEVMKFLEALHDDECKECGFPSLDGVWYDGTCEDCHNEIMERSIYSALKVQEAGNETVQG
jgi:hypothetical protein